MQAIVSAPPIPRKPIAIPLSTLVPRKAIPWIVPTIPFALAWRSTGSSSVTVVDSAMFRICATIAPVRITPTKTQNHGPWKSRTVDCGWRRYSRHAAEKAVDDRALAMMNGLCRDERSTRVPNGIELTAMSSM